MKKLFAVLLLVVLLMPLGLLAEVIEVTPVPVVVVAEPIPFFSLTGIVLTVIGLLSLVLARYAIPWMKSHTNVNQRNLLKLVVSTLVFAAEQMYEGAGRGAEKMLYVKDELRKRGFDIDIAEIEAAVRELNILQDDLFEEDLFVEDPPDLVEPVSQPMMSGTYGNTQDAVE